MWNELKIFEAFSFKYRLLIEYKNLLKLLKVIIYKCESQRKAKTNNLWMRMWKIVKLKKNPNFDSMK